MTPTRLLRLWRERWGKGTENLPDRPYARGKIHDLLYRLPRSEFWSRPMLGRLLVTCGALFALLAVQIEFSLNGQITYAGILVALAVFARRFAGHLFTLLLINLGGMAAVSYFHWRLSNTLSFRSRTELLLGLALCLLEMAWALFVFARAGSLLWPIWRPSRMLSADDARPTVDVITSTNTLDERQALAHLERLAALDWDAERKRLYIIDARKRAAIARFAERTGAVVVEPARTGAPSADGAANGPAARSPRSARRSDWDDALGCGQGDFVALIAPGAQVDADLLERTIGWFVAQTGLALIYGADAEGAPRQCAGLVPRAGADRGAGVSLLRRAAWQQAQSHPQYDPAQPTGQLRSASALMLPEASRLRIAQTAALAIRGEPTAADDSYVIVERADSRALMTLKRALVHLQAMLRFYSPVPRALLLVLPAIVLIGDLRPVRFHASVALAYAVPYLLLLAMIHDRGDTSRRWGTLLGLRELILAIYVPLLTAAAFVRTSLANPALFLRRSFDRRHATPLPARALTCYGLAALNGVALCQGLMQVALLGKAHHHGMHAAYLTVCALAALNLGLLLARQAMVHEARHIVGYLQSATRLPATLTFADGATMNCHTSNFPAEPLELEFESAPSRASAPLGLTIEFNGQPFALVVEGPLAQGRRASVRIDEQSAAEFGRLCNQVMARDRNWPAWLAHKEADLILPPWLHARLSKLPVWFIDTSTKLAGALRAEQLLLIFKK